MVKTKVRLMKLLGALICAVLCLYNLGSDMTWLRSLPDTIYIYEDGEDGALKALDESVSASHSFDQSLFEATGEAVLDIKLFQELTVKKVQLKKREDVKVMPGGSIVGLHVLTDGILVVGFGEVQTDDGSISPAKEAGILQGDIIIAANGEALRDAAHLSSFSGSQKVELRIVRNGDEITLDIMPERDVRDGVYKLGIWVRDDTAGLGTLSFVTEEGFFASLGHGIKDSDTGVTISAAGGTLNLGDVIGIIRSTRGVPGEIQGVFSKNDNLLGDIKWCSDTGTYGSFTANWVNPLYKDGIALGYPEEAHTGDAILLSGISEGSIQEYDCRIIKVFRQNTVSPRSMIVEITDKELLELTGGIVQGMSGSPIIQDGKLIGVITHVIINEPAKGYCLYAWWMYSEITQGAMKAA